MSAETFDINVGGLGRLLRIIERQKPDTRLYQASSSEMSATSVACAVRALLSSPPPPMAHQKCRRISLRGSTAVAAFMLWGNFVQPRVTNAEVRRWSPADYTAAAAMALGDTTKLKLGNLQARRDWGFAGDYVKAMHKMLQQPAPKDYVIGLESLTAWLNSYRLCLQNCTVFSAAGRGPDAGKVRRSGSRLLRTGEIHDLRADATLASKELGWKPEVDFSRARADDD